MEGGEGRGKRFGLRYVEGEERTQGSKKLKTKNTHGEERTRGEEMRGKDYESEWNHKKIKFQS